MQTTSFQQALSLARAGAKPDVAWLVPLLACADADAPELYRTADTVRAAAIGDGGATASPGGWLRGMKTSFGAS